MANGIYNLNEAVCLVTIDGVTLDNVPFDTFEGGVATVDMQTYMPGGQGAQIPTGGLETITNIVVSRAWTPLLFTYYMTVHNARNSTATVSYMPQIKGVPDPKPLIYKCVLGTVTRPNYDHASADTAYLSMEFGVADTVSQG